MAPSLANIPDRYLWLGLGVFTFFAVQHVSRGLRTIRALTELHNPPSSPPLPSQPAHLPPNPTHQEDAIKTSSLLTLATSPNIDIRNSATKILCHRFYANRAAKKLLVKDLNSKNEEIRHRAHLAFDLLATHDALRDISVPSPSEGWRVHEPAVPRAEADAADLRRRRREAVVIHDGDAERGGDVYMRDREGRMLSEEVAGLQESIAQLREADRILQAGLDELIAGRAVRRQMG
ncbi:hypothetical protein CC86DRAFT_135372 [Ophiobolus disseminans]|uniref:Uncharacterized protein n=1 Tax=Ophiobolus disseminans TaxID=1469910 RepID=A0A6A7AD21_9PLEO|nr:hypothetical protein CC86DRAFT_135372 [Ophiobolus disseminans]